MHIRLIRPTPELCPGPGKDEPMRPPVEALTKASAAAHLRQLLTPHHWPLPPEVLPPGCALVGGAVRDGLLGRLGPHPDLDLVVPAGAIPLARQLARRFRGTAVLLDAERDMARVVLGPWTIDLAAQAGPNLVADLGRRDYCLNAMALPLAANAPLLDPCGGLADLAAGQIRAVGEANLLADPLRLLRGPRLAAELGFELAPATQALLARHGSTLAQVAPERVLAELEKLAHCPGGSQGLAQALGLGLLGPWLTALGGTDPLPLLQSLRNPGPLTAPEAQAGLPLARLALLFDARALGRLRASRRWQQRCERLRHWWERLNKAQGQELPEAAQLQLCRELEADLPALVLLAPRATRGWLGRWRNPNDPLFHPKPALDGVSLQRELGMAPGPELGKLLEKLAIERAFGRPCDMDSARNLRRD